MGWEPYWDEEGIYHVHDPNVRPATYQCSFGHRWEGALNGCEACRAGARPERRLPPTASPNRRTTTVTTKLCDHKGKRRFQDELSAMLALSSARDPTTRNDGKRNECRYFRCPTCRGWFLTSWESARG